MKISIFIHWCPWCTCPCVRGTISELPVLGAFLWSRYPWPKVRKTNCLLRGLETHLCTPPRKLQESVATTRE